MLHRSKIADSSYKTKKGGLMLRFSFINLHGSIMLFIPLWFNFIAALWTPSFRGGYPLRLTGGSEPVTRKQQLEIRNQ